MDNWVPHDQIKRHSLARDKTLWPCEGLEDTSLVSSQVLFEEETVRKSSKEVAHG